MNFTEPFFDFCPKCQSQTFTFDNLVKFKCNSCQFEYFHNIAAAVAVIFTHKNRILFTVRNEEPDKGKWDLPGGFIDPNENAEEASCREIQEELGIAILPKQLRYITSSPNKYLYKGVPYRTMDLFFECELEFDTIQIAAKKEISELIWVNRDEIDLDKIGFVSIRKVIKELYLSRIV